MIDKQKEKKSAIYVIDQDFRIIYSNDELNRNLPEFEYGQHCYKVLCQEDGPCRKCPLKEENNGQSILFDRLHNEWVSASATTIDWPGAGKCYLIMCDNVTDKSTNFFYNARSKSDYDELLELNYSKDSYNIAYHGRRKGNENHTQGVISTMVRKVAERSIHPDDRQRFYDFWLLDKVGCEGVPAEVLGPRHGEFRRVEEDGSYSWVQQVFIPVRQSSKEEIFVNSFFNVIDMPNITEEVDNKAKSIRVHKEHFFKLAEKLLQEIPDDEKWSILAIDIEKLKLFNEWYGRETGDILLTAIYEYLKVVQERLGGIVGYFDNDDFAMFIPCDDARLEELCHDIADLIKKHSGKINVLPAVGVYEITDKKVPIYKAYDRANLACTSVKGNYAVRIKKFDHAMLEQIQSEYILFADIQKAFNNNEFTFFLQPKCNMKNGKIIGAEALARWNSQEKGMVSPGVFIPFLEKNGLVSELDTYIWEEVCKWQRSMLDRGLPTVPVSVNVSRADLYSVDVVEYFGELMDKYRLDPKLIEIEITEGAYAEDATGIGRVASKLRQAGFCVSMDDFGSAYSSLNMLKDMDLDVLKIDMRFLQLEGENAGRGIDILETVCNMAHILGLNIVAEGVETENQKNILQAAGCSYGQGYYFYRPLAVADFEKNIEKNNYVTDEDFRSEQTVLFNLKDLMNKNMLSQNMVNNMLGAVAFYDVYDGQISVVRFNEKYTEILGNASLHPGKSLQSGLIYEEEIEKIYQMFAEAQKNRNVGASGDVHLCRKDGTDMWIHLRLFFLYQRDGHAVFYGTVDDATEIHRSNAILRFLNSDMPGGYYRHKNNADCDFTYISDRFLEICGFTREEIKREFDNKYINMVHPDDRAAVANSIAAMEQNGGNYSLPCRIRSKSGYISVIDQCRLVHYDNLEIFQGLILCDLDHYKWLSDDGQDLDEDNVAINMMPCGVFQSEADGDHQFTYISNSTLRMLGYSRSEFEKKFNNCTENMVYIEDRKRIDEDIYHQLQIGNYVSCEYRVEMADGSLKWVYSRGRLTTDHNGKRWFYTCIIDSDYLKEIYRTKEWQYQKYKSLAEIPGMIVYDYDPRTDCLTVERSNESGEIDTIIAENYIRDIEAHQLLAKDCVEEQKSLLLAALESPVNGSTDLKARFFKDSEYEWFRFYYKSLSDENGNVYRIVGRGDNIQEERRSISNWKKRAMNDSLTGLLNHEAAKDRAEKVLKHHKGGILFLIDIDNFKKVNDSLGHLAGDELLKKIAGLIRMTFRRRDISARFGGDEFLVFIPEFFEEEQIQTSKNRAEEILEKISEIQPAENLQIHCSIGIAVARDNDTSFEEVFNKADIALYRSKHAGKNTYRFYEE